jgi:DNA-binding NarL/FixJ family response regulator
MAPNTPIRVLLVDDHAVVRAGYRRFLEHNRMMEVVGEAGSSDEAYQLFRLMKPDVVVMDISLPGASGIEATRRMLALDGRARVLMFSMHAQPAFARQALEAGAIGFLTKDTEPEALVQAVIAAAQGRRTLSPRVAEQLALDNVMPDEKRLDVLTPREFEICRLLLAGMTVDEIADALKLSPKTISNRMSEIRQKLDVRSDVELVRLATAAGLVPWAARPDVAGEAPAV